MSKFVRAFTYAPKIEGVKDGTITQTIRPGMKLRKGDEILFHGWSDKPYRSPWNWRRRVTVTEVRIILIFSDGFVVENASLIVPWKGLDDIAILDGIEPIDDHSPGESMGALFNKMYPRIKDDFFLSQIITWSPDFLEATP